MANQEDVQDIVEAAVNRISSSERLQLLQVQSRIASFYSLKATLGSPASRKKNGQFFWQLRVPCACRVLVRVFARIHVHRL